MSSRSLGITRGIVAAMAVGVVTFGGLHTTSAVEVGVESNSAPPSASVSMCVYMSGSNNKVAGIQMQLRWDGGCVSVTPQAGHAAMCTGMVAGKTLSTAIGTQPCGNDPNCLMALLVSVSDTEPMNDQELFCCSFIVADNPSQTNCPFALGGVIASDPVGQRISDVNVVPGVLTISAPQTGGRGGVGGAPAIAPGVGSVVGGAPAAPAAAAGAAAGAAAAGAAGVGGAPRGGSAGTIAPGIPVEEAPAAEAPQAQEGAPAAPTPAAVTSPAAGSTPTPKGTTAAAATATPKQTPKVTEKAATTPTPKATHKTHKAKKSHAKTPTPQAKDAD